MEGADDDHDHLEPPMRRVSIAVASQPISLRNKDSSDVFDLWENKKMLEEMRLPLVTPSQVLSENLPQVETEDLLGEELEKFRGQPMASLINHHYWVLDGQASKPFKSPMLGSSRFSAIYGGHGSVPEETFVCPLSMVKYCCQLLPSPTEDWWFLKAGPRKQIYYQPKKVTAAIVTCGGLCPGLNVVIREIVSTLANNYGVETIYGIQYGYKGFYTYNWIELSPQNTQFIHKQGGTLLGSSRGGFDLNKIMRKIKARNVRQLYIVGGDGTMRGAKALYEELVRQKLDVSVVGLPKTIDNDIAIIDRSFGYQTAVEHAVQAINSAETEAMSAEYGVGLVKLMGRSAGHIALEACLSHRGVSVLLIPEMEFEIGGRCGLLEHIFRLLLTKHHCVVVVAEGAAEAAKDIELTAHGRDPSGNAKLPNIGVFLSERITAFCKEKGIDVTLKYIDPTYMIRTIPSNPSDTNMCSALAYDAVHGAMAGFTGFCTGIVNNKTAYIPLELITQSTRRVKVKSKMWQRLIAATGQPSFINNEEDYANEHSQSC